MQNSQKKCVRQDGNSRHNREGHDQSQAEKHVQVLVVSEGRQFSRFTAPNFRGFHTSSTSIFGKKGGPLVKFKSRRRSTHPLSLLGTGVCACETAREPPDFSKVSRRKCVL
eukprot:6823066-Heterocapsa_arctica.AAC.1